MAIIALKAWYLKEYQPIREIVKRPHDLRLSRNSLLKSALRADFLDGSETVREAEWFDRYLEGEKVEFYIEGSGGYAIANIDLLSHEIYFIKQEISGGLDPRIFVSYQQEYPWTVREGVKEAMEKLNERSRLPMELQLAKRPSEGALRLSDSQLRQIRKSLPFIADTTAIASYNQHLLLSPHVCVELGYAIQNKKPGQILLIKQKRPELTGEFPFDLPHHQQLELTNPEELGTILPQVMENLLHKFNLFS